MTNTSRDLPERWQWAKLDDVCEKRTGKNDPREHPAKVFHYVDITSVDNVGKRIVSPKLLRGKDAPSRARQVILAGDVIVATTRPNLNAVALVPDNLHEQICSTGFCVLRPTHALDQSYLFAFVQTQDFVEALTDLTRGAMYPAVTDAQVRQRVIPLPSLSEQRRIAAILTEQMAAVEKARAAAEAQLAAAQALPAAYLREVFDSEEARRWPKMALGDVCSIVAEQVDPKSPEFAALPHVNGERIVSRACQLVGVQTAAEDKMTSPKYLFSAGDVLYSKLRPYLQKAAVAPYRGVCSADMYPIRPNPTLIDRDFLCWLLVSDSFTVYADNESRRARMPKLNRDQLFAYAASLPPLARQREITGNLREAFGGSDRLCTQVRGHLEGINKLSAALLRQAFSGQV